MNTELKAILSVVLDCFKIEQDIVVHRKPVNDILPNIFGLLSGVMVAVTGYSTLKAELKAMKGRDEEADLLEFVALKFGSELPNTKAQAILKASVQIVLDLIKDGFALAEAINTSNLGTSEMNSGLALTHSSDVSEHDSLGLI